MTDPEGRVWAIVVAAGTGTRYGRPKQYEDLNGRPVLAWSLAAAGAACDRVVVVVPPGDVEGCTWDADAVVGGGATRSESVRAGLAAVGPGAEVVVVHDAARPLAPPAVWAAVIGAVDEGADAAVPTVPVTDTVKEVGDNGSLTTLDRSRLVAVQTPQAFRAAALRAAHAGAAEATDDAALVEERGGRVATVTGSPRNLKITAPGDVAVAAALLALDPPRNESGRSAPVAAASKMAPR